MAGRDVQISQAKLGGQAELGSRALAHALRGSAGERGECQEGSSEEGVGKHGDCCWCLLGLRRDEDVGDVGCCGCISDDSDDRNE